MDQGVSLYIDPSGAQTGGRVVKREFQEIGQAAVNAQQRIDQMMQITQQAAKSAQASAQAIAQQQDAMRAKFNPTYAVLSRYKQMQDEIRQAHRLGALSVNEMSAALSRERQSALSAVAAIKSHTAAFASNTAAIHANNAAARIAAFQRANLLFQLNDVAVSLASGMNPLMVAVQQGSQISQIYGGQGGVVAALRETANMAGNAASRFGKWGLVLGPLALALGNVKEQATEALRSSVSWGEVMTATFQVIRDGLQGAFGPAISTLLDPLFYAFGKLQSAAVDIAELIINSFRAAGADIAFVWDQLPNVVGGAFLGAANIAIDNLNMLVKASKEAVNQIIAAVNLIPGVDLSKLDTSGQAIPRLENTFATDFAKAAAEHAARQQGIMSSTPIRDLGGSIVDGIGTNRARSRLSGLADMDFSQSTQGANALGQALGSVGQQAQTAYQTVIDVNQQMMDARRQTLATFEQSGNQLRTMKTELKDIQATLAAAAQTPVSEVFGWDIGDASGAIEAAASSISKVFKALDGGQITAKTAHESLELIRASLHQLGGDTPAVDKFMDSMTNAYMRVGQLESGIKSLSSTIMGIPNRVIDIGIRQYTVPSSGGGTTGVNVYGGNADFSYQSYNVGGRSVGVSGGNGFLPPQQGLVDAYDYAMMNQTLGYGGARAAGGPVSSGETYLVGENGPELVTMGGAGMVANTNSTASILSGGRDTLSLMEDHLYNLLNEAKIHTNYLEVANDNYDTMITALQAIKVSAASSASYSRGGGSSMSSSGGGSRGWGGYTDGSAMPYNSGVDFSSVYNFMGVGSYNGTGAIGYDTYGISPSVHGTNTGMRDLHTPYFATGGQIMPGEDQKVELFKKNSERVIIVDDKKVTDSRGGQSSSKSERPIQIINHFHGGDMADKRSQQAMVDQFRRAVLQVRGS